ncbi:hypothetical protein DBT_1575 [Dissulfuribacter thermophilus]|uniref:Uncharacterized protein n=1 Tax=Dissulfuribacter thermophilus TaxID=1156395 RepID=A0A1B9F558_9BACT|nr:hypothetical protein [Dissulfuribacter thermophilus]OCC15089.1 hypothetical protein DBT_1575 [Dissulfuribacter thermophilus]
MKDWIVLFTPLAVLFWGALASIFFAQTLSSPNYRSVSVSRWYFNASNLLELKKKERKETQFSHLTIPSGASSPFYYESQKMMKTTVKEETEKLPELELTMIISIGSSKKLCRINGTLYEEGESGPNFKVLNILNDRVRVLGENHEILTIKFKKDDGDSAIVTKTKTN